MKTKVKTLQGVLFELEIAQDDTVKRVKEKLAELKPETFVAEGMKLIFAGKILVDDKILLSEYGVKETDFLVAMSTKPPQNAVDPNLQRLIDMGFDKDQATNALQAAGNNPDIAAELLMGGGDGDNDAVMPPAATTPSPAQQTAAATPAAAANAPSAVPIGESPGTTPFPAMGAVAGSGGGGGGGGGGGMFGFGGGGGGGTIFCNYGSTKGDVPNGGNRRSNVPNEKVKSLDECEAEIESGGTTTTEQTPAPTPATTPAESPPPSDSTASPDSTETEPAGSTDTASDSSDTASPAPGSTPADAKDKKNDDGNKQTYIIVGCIAGAVLLFMVFRGNNNSNDPEKDAKASGNNKGKGKGTTQAKKMRQQEQDDESEEEQQDRKRPPVNLKSLNSGKMGARIPSNIASKLEAKN
eukprot:GEMP01044982.1.p1 GENE.GEMP01044982.1~~GEMP01044982.1.p1  ORF type:complete len:411 (+),score=124.07 GEMP01044982.1:44-1276(+)